MFLCYHKNHRGVPNRNDDDLPFLLMRHVWVQNNWRNLYIRTILLLSRFLPPKIVVTRARLLVRGRRARCILVRRKFFRFYTKLLDEIELLVKNWSIKISKSVSLNFSKTKAYKFQRPLGHFAVDSYIWDH